METPSAGDQNRLSALAGLTLEETHGAVETLRAQLVVAERSQELRNHDIGLLWDVDGAHITVDDVYCVMPLSRFAFL